MRNRVRNPVQFVLREYLRLLWADSDWQADWQRVRRGEMEFLQFERNKLRTSRQRVQHAVERVAEMIENSLG